MPHHILLTVDVEDWFQVENFKPWIPFDSWDSRELRVEKNTHRILDLLDEAGAEGSAFSVQVNDASRGSCQSCQTRTSPKATFFVLGWIAERLPRLVREIRDRGHEVASHGYGHEICSRCSTDFLKKDLARSRKLLEDITGTRVQGYRAPSFSTDDRVLRVIAEAGYLYDSSYNSFSLHGRYGKIAADGNKRKGIAHLISKNFYELPISNLTICNPFSLQLSATGSEQNRGSFVLPWGGGAYFRLLPAGLFRLGVRRILDQQGAYLFYLHPWELDPGQPRVEGASLNSRFRHYSNLGKTHRRLERLIESFSDCRFVTCADYLELGFAK
jgi:peptidoglycan-N-acetylglucosamine deacetylase